MPACFQIRFGGTSDFSGTSGATPMPTEKTTVQRIRQNVSGKVLLRCLESANRISVTLANGNVAVSGVKQSRRLGIGGTDRNGWGGLLCFLNWGVARSGRDSGHNTAVK